LKILDEIVRSVAVDVMHGLMRKQRPSQVPRHHQTVFEDVSYDRPHRSVGMIRLKTNMDVALFIDPSAALPLPMAFATNICDDPMVIEGTCHGLRADSHHRGDVRDGVTRRPQLDDAG
jgi:hypothetical protein